MVNQISNIKTQISNGPAQPDNYRVSLQEYDDRLKSV